MEKARNCDPPLFVLSIEGLDVGLLEDTSFTFEEGGLPLPIADKLSFLHWGMTYGDLAFGCSRRAIRCMPRLEQPKAKSP